MLELYYPLLTKEVGKKVIIVNKKSINGFEDEKLFFKDSDKQIYCHFKKQKSITQEKGVIMTKTTYPSEEKKLYIASKVFSITSTGLLVITIFIMLFEILPNLQNDFMLKSSVWTFFLIFLFLILFLSSTLYINKKLQSKLNITIYSNEKYQKLLSFSEKGLEYAIVRSIKNPFELAITREAPIYSLKDGQWFFIKDGKKKTDYEIIPINPQ